MRKESHLPNRDVDLAVYLENHESGPNQFVRVDCHSLVHWTITRAAVLERNIYVQQNPIIPVSFLSRKATGFWIRGIDHYTADETSSGNNRCRPSHAWPTSQWSSNKDMLYMTPDRAVTLAAFWYMGARARTVCLSFEKPTGEFRIAVVGDISTSLDDADLEKIILTSLSKSTSSTSEGSFEVSEPEGMYRLVISARIRTLPKEGAVVLAVTVGEINFYK